MIKYLAFLLSVVPLVLLGQIKVSANNNNGFPIVNKQSVSSIIYDAEDFPVVRRSAELLAVDIFNITGQKPILVSDPDFKKRTAIIIGTIGTSRIIDKLVEEGKIDISQIENDWERFTIQVVDKPLKGIQQALVIAGSDKRGTAYGAFSLSEAMGVSPWYYWADVPVKKSKTLFLENTNFTSKAPSVKYRGKHKAYLWKYC